MLTLHGFFIQKNMAFYNDTGVVPIQNTDLDRFHNGQLSNGFMYKSNRFRMTWNERKLFDLVRTEIESQGFSIINQCASVKTFFCGSITQNNSEWHRCNGTSKESKEKRNRSMALIWREIRSYADFIVCS